MKHLGQIDPKTGLVVMSPLCRRPAVKADGITSDVAELDCVTCAWSLYATLYNDMGVVSARIHRLMTMGGK